MKVKYKVRKTPAGEWVIDVYHLGWTRPGFPPTKTVVWQKTHWFDDHGTALRFALRMAYGR